MRRLASTVMTLVMVVASAGAAQAGSPQPFKCTGSLGAVTVHGDLKVPAGQSCELLGTTITGNVTDQGSLVACGVHIGGDLIGNHAESLVLGFLDPTNLPCDSTVGGNVLADHTRGGPNLLCNTRVGGNVTVQNSSRGVYWEIGPESDSGVGFAGQVCGGLTVGGNLDVHNNLGGVDISDNNITGNLICKNNTPAPDGDHNIVGGNAQGQCASFAVQTLVIPNDLANSPGNLAAFSAVHEGQGGATSARVQQLFLASQFASVTGPILITGFAWRPNAATGNDFNVTLPDVEIDLAATSVSSLSNTFADNLTDGEQTVFSGPLHLSGTLQLLGNGTAAFDILSRFQTPFLYDPTQGKNLLVDVRLLHFPSGSFTFTTVDAQQPFFGSGSTAIATVLTRHSCGEDASSAAGCDASTAGVVTQFQFEPE